MADLFRFWWSLWYWNARKTLFALRGRRGPAPCQHPSDSGRAGQTGCEACLSFDRRERFRRVCPLLRETPQGWRCAVDRSAVRPFWGRAIGWTFGAAAVLYLAAAGVGFAVLRGVGYEALQFRDFFSLAARERLRLAQARYYERRAESALAEGDLRESILALSIAFRKDSTNWPAGLALAQLLQRTRQYYLADQVFARLIADFPAEAESVATLWAEALLRRGDFADLALLAAGRLEAGTPRPGVWLRTLLRAVRRVEDPTEFAALAERVAPRLPAVQRDWLVVEKRIRAGDRAGARAALESGRVLEAFAGYYRTDALLRLGEPAAAGAVLREAAAFVGPVQAAVLAYRVAQAGPVAALADVDFENLIAPPLDADRLAAAAAELVRRPAPLRLRRLSAVAAAGPAGDGLPAVAAIAVAAHVNGELEWAIEWERRAGERSPELAEALRAFGRFARGEPEQGTLRWYLDALPLPTETIWALHEWSAARGN